jgi:hypothetical protein
MRSEALAMEPWIKNTRLVTQWLEIKKDVELHKWYESEKAGHDIGWDRAFTDWLIRYGGRHRRRRPPKG